MSDLSTLPSAYREWVAGLTETQWPYGSPRHRTIPPPPRRKRRELEGVLYSICRLCNEPIRKPDGSPDRRRGWHPACVELYLSAQSTQQLRRIVFRRDQGVCA